MALDVGKNFAKATLSTGYASGATSLVLTTGGGARFPAPPFNATYYDSGVYADPSDDPSVEIVRVTVVSTDTFTVTRAQEGTSAANHNTAGHTYTLVAGPTAKLLTDILGISITGDASLDVKADGTRALTGGWNAGNFRIDSQNSTLDFNIIAYGADPTGAASSVAAINAAIAAMPANGGVLRAPTGTYLIDSTITLSKSVTIIGDGGEAAATYLTRFLKKSTLAGPVFSVQASGVSLRDFYVDGNTGGGATGDGILIIGTSQMFTASRVTVAYNSATGWNMGNNTAAVTDDFKFDACISMLNGGHGWMLNSITPDTNGGTFIDCHALNNTGDGYQFLHAQFNAMFGGSAQSNGANGAHFMVGSAQNSIYGGDYELNVGSNILIDAAATTVSIFGILTSKITNNSVSTYGTNIFGDTILSTNAGANSLRLVGSGGATSISQFPTGAAAYLDNLAVSQATTFRSSNASSADTTWLTVSGPGVATFQKPLLAGTVIAESETNKALANGANENITVTSPFVYITGPTAVFSIGGVVATAEIG